MSKTDNVSGRPQSPRGLDSKIGHEIMLDLDEGRVAYAVLSFGGFLGVGNKLFAVPWEALEVDTENKALVFNVPKEKLEQAPGFDKDNWPKTTDRQWLAEVHTYYGYDPYWH